MSDVPDYIRATFDYHNVRDLARRLRAGIDAGDPDIRAAEELMSAAADVIDRQLDEFCRLYPMFKHEHLLTKCYQCHERLGPLCAKCEAA